MSKLTPRPTANDHVRGSADAPVTLVEFGDYECPHCRRAHAVVREVMRRMGTSVQLHYRHFPLAKIHPHAFLAAEAAESVGAAKFWPMHDALFEHQDALSPDDLVAYAAALGVDTERFIRELETHTHRPRVESDFRAGVRNGVNGTPTFFINGMRYDHPPDADALTAALQAALQRNA